MLQLSYITTIYVGYRYNEKYNVEPEFCFGHGLSYTKFEYDNLEINPDEKTVSCVEKNVGEYDGSEIVQVYVHKKDSKLVKELAGFDKIFLKKNESAKVTIEIEAWQDEAEWYVGSSLSDIRLSN